MRRTLSFRGVAAALTVLAVAACDTDQGMDPIDDQGQAGPVVFLEPVMPPPPIAYWLTVIHNNDGESQLLNAGGSNTDFGGMHRFATVVENLRAEAVIPPSYLTSPAPRGEILVSSGDNFIPSKELNVSLENGAPWFDAIGLDHICYDAMAIGNHEFDLGPEALADFMSGFVTCPMVFVSANLDTSGEPELEAFRGFGRLAESVIVDAGNGEMVGVIGATTPLLATISSPRNAVADPDLVGAISAEVTALQDLGIDKIVLISHLQSVQEDLDLIPQLSGIDVVVAGGGDEVLASRTDRLIPGDTRANTYPVYAQDADGNTVPVVTTAGEYNYVGNLVVGFDANGKVVAVDRGRSGTNRVAGGSNVDAVTPNAFIQANVVDPVAAGVADIDSNVIGSTEVPLDGVRENVRTGETNVGNLVGDAVLWQAQELGPQFGVSEVHVAIWNGGGIRNNNVLPAGDLTEGTMFDILPFGNIVSVLELTREEFKAIMEHGVALAPTVQGRFPHPGGFSFSYSVSAPAGSRVQDITLSDGTKIVENGAVVAGDNIVLASGDFLLGGGDGYPFPEGLVRLGVADQKALQNFIEGPLGGVVTAAAYPEGGNGTTTQLP